MVTELFTILVKSFSIYSLGFVLANFRKTPIKKEINFGLEHSLVGLLALIFISWSSYLIFNNALLNIQYYFYIFLTIVLLIRFKNFILKQYLQLFVIVSILFFIVNFFELNTSTNDSIAYFYTEGLNFKNKQFSLLIDFRSIPLIIISGYFDIININYVAIIPGLVNTLGLLSINSYLKKNNFFLQNDIFSKIFRFILLFTPVLIFHLFYLNVHFLFGILLTFILFQHYLLEEFDHILYFLALSIFLILRLESLMIFLISSFFLSKKQLVKNTIVLKQVIFSNIFMFLTWFEIFSNESTNTRGIGQVPESLYTIIIYHSIFFVCYYLFIYKLNKETIYLILQGLFVLGVSFMLLITNEIQTILGMLSPSGIWSIVPIYFIFYIFYLVKQNTNYYRVLFIPVIWVFFAFIQTPQLFDGLGYYLTDYIFGFLNENYGVHNNNVSICRDFTKSSACQRTFIQIFIPIYYFSQYDLLTRNKYNTL